MTISIKDKWIQMSMATLVGFGIGYILGKRKVSVYNPEQITFIDENGTLTTVKVTESVIKTENSDIDVKVYEAEKNDSIPPEVVETLAKPKRNRRQKAIDEIDIAVDEVNAELDAMVLNRNKASEVVETVTAADETESDDVEAAVHIFTLDDGDWNHEQELSTRDPAGPYIIHQEEFINDEMGYSQETLTYYRGDDIMSDTDDTPIYNYAGMMGELKFGHGSKDPNVVYIRNEAIHMEWEILLNEGFYSQEVLGLEMDKAVEDELRHSVQKFRSE